MRCNMNKLKRIKTARNYDIVSDNNDAYLCDAVISQAIDDYMKALVKLSTDIDTNAIKKLNATIRDVESFLMGNECELYIVGSLHFDGITGMDIYDKLTEYKEAIYGQRI